MLSPLLAGNSKSDNGVVAALDEESLVAWLTDDFVHSIAATLIVVDFPIFDCRNDVPDTDMFSSDRRLNHLRLFARQASSFFNWINK